MGEQLELHDNYLNSLMKMLLIVKSLLLLLLTALPLLAHSRVLPESNLLAQQSAFDATDRILIAEQDGIQVYAESFYTMNYHYIVLHFENTTDAEVSFTWSLYNGDEAYIITQDGLIQARMQIPAHSSGMYGMKNQEEPLLEVRGENFPD